MRLSSNPSVARFKAHDLKDLLTVSRLISSPAFKIQFAIVRRGVGFMFPAKVNWWIPSSTSQWSYFSVVRALKGLFQLISGACIYCVHPLGTIFNLFFAWSGNVTVFTIHASSIRNKNDEMRKCQELYSPKYEWRHLCASRRLGMSHPLF